MWFNDLYGNILRLVVHQAVAQQTSSLQTHSYTHSTHAHIHT